MTAVKNTGGASFDGHDSAGRAEVEQGLYLSVSPGGINVKASDTVSVAEAAERLGVHNSTLYESLRRGEIPCIQLGKRKLIPRPAFEQWLQHPGERHASAVDIEAIVKQTVREVLASFGRALEVDQ